MDDPSFSGIQDAERKGAAALPHLFPGESCHRLKLCLARLTKTVGVNNEPMFPFELSSVNLKENRLEGIQQFGIFHQCQASVVAVQAEQAPFIDPSRRYLQIKAHAADNIGQKFFRFLASFIHSLTYAFLGFTFFVPTGFAFRGTSFTTTVESGVSVLFKLLITICWPKLTTFPKNQ